VTIRVTVGRWMALMFPSVMLILNLSSVAVLWFGGQRVDAGLMEVGALTAFLAYLLQILMAVMMTTFLLVLVPRATVHHQLVLGQRDHGWSDADRAVDRATSRFGPAVVRPARLLTGRA